MPASRDISGPQMPNRQTSNIHNTNIDWHAIEESLQDDNTKSIADILSQLNIQETSSTNHSGAASETLILTSIEKLHHNDIVIRSGAAAVLTHAFLTNNKSITPHLISFVRALIHSNLLDLKSGRSSKEYVTLHTNLCSLINEMQFKEPDKLLPHFKPLANYLVQCTAHENCDIATGACEYWARLPVPPVPEKHLDPWIPAVMANLGKLIPNLIRCLIYHEEHIKYLESRRNTSSSSGRDTPTHMEKFTNKRNYAAMGLENIARIFSTETINTLKPCIQKWLNSKDWLEVEAIILAIGALTQALGAPRDLKDLYPSLIMPRLLESFKHPQPLVRSITCFTVQLLVNMDPKSLNIKDPFAKVVRNTLQLLRDPNEEVQQMSAQCLSTMLAYSTKDISAYGRKLIDEVIQAEKVIQGQARFTYYECIAHLFGRMSAQMEREDVTCLMVPFMNHWNTLDPEYGSSGASNVGQDILLLSQPLCTVAMYGRYHMEPYNREILEKVVKHLVNVTSDSSSTLTTQKTVAYLDITSALLEGQGNHLSAVLSDLEVVNSAVKVLQASKLGDAIHQSVLALLGNLSKHCYSLVHPKIETVIPILQKDMNSQMTEIRNNAIWALFNVIQNCPDCQSQFDEIGEDLVNLLKKQDVGDEGITVNGTLALTSLAAKWPDKYASLLTTDMMFSTICTTMQRPFPRDLEKVTLYNNVCKALSYDFTNISVTGWVQFCIAAALLESPDDQLRLKLKNTLHNGRSSMGNKNWAKVTQQIGSQLASTLRRRFRLY